MFTYIPQNIAPVYTFRDLILQSQNQAPTEIDLIRSGNKIDKNQKNQQKQKYESQKNKFRDRERESSYLFLFKVFI